MIASRPYPTLSQGVCAESVEEITGEPATPAPEKGRKRRAAKRFIRRLLGRPDLSPFAIASFLAAPEAVDAAYKGRLGPYKGRSVEQLVADLKADGAATDAAINLATTSVLPYLPGKEPPGVESTERP